MRNNQGLTVLEIVVAMGIFVIASIMVAGFIIQNFKAQNFSLEQSASINEARRGIETMVKELREALPGDTGAYPIDSANAQELIFYADYDRDTQIERVHYWLDGTEFKKGVIEASGNPLTYSEEEEVHIISRYVRNNSIPLFTYRDGEYAEISAPADPTGVKLISVYLEINVFEDRAPMNFELQSDVALRNLKENF